MSGATDFLAAARGRLHAARSRSTTPASSTPRPTTQERRAVERELGDRLLAAAPASRRHGAAVARGWSPA